MTEKLFIPLSEKPGNKARERQSLLNRIAQAKFIVLEASTGDKEDTPIKVICFSSELIEHIDLFRKAQEKYSECQFVGAGSINQQGEISWGSISCRDRFRYDRPKEETLQEHLLETVAEQFTRLLTDFRLKDE